METIVAPNINVVKRGVLIGSATKLGSGSGGILAIRNLSQSLTLPTTIIRVIGTPQMVFTNSIMTTHVNKIANRPLMNSLAPKGYKNADVVNPREDTKNHLL